MYSIIYVSLLKALLFLSFIIRDTIFSLFLAALQMHLHSVLQYLAYSPELIFTCIFCSVYAIVGFSATKQHMEAMKKNFYSLKG